MDAFLEEGEESPLTPIASYLRNRALSEALYPSLHMFEISIRNAVHYAMTREYKREDWYDEPNLLRANEMDRVVQAKEEVTSRGKDVTAGRVVAELMLGFWTALFSSPYEIDIVRPVIRRTMKKAPSDLKNRHAIAQRLHQAKDLRNRVVHHEPIRGYGDLADTHQMLYTVSGWMYPVYTQMCSRHDRFVEVLGLPAEHYLKEVERVVQMYEAIRSR